MLIPLNSNPAVKGGFFLGGGGISCLHIDLDNSVYARARGEGVCMLIFVCLLFASATFDEGARCKFSICIVLFSFTDIRKCEGFCVCDF